jgi:acetyltransferase-like isoleucine patch superfamily enzyme
MNIKIMLRKIYLSPLGYLISIVFQLIGRFHRPFMVYGYWNSPTSSFRRLTRVSSTAFIIDKNNVNIGENCWVWHHSIIDGSNGVTIGKGVQIGAWVGIFSHSSHVAIRLHGENYINVDKHNRIGYVRSPVTIGDYSFVGAGAFILPGVSIGRGCLVAAGSVVSKSIPDFSIASGNPAKVIGSTLSMDKKYFDSPIVQSDYFDKDVINQWISESKSTGTMN